MVLKSEILQLVRRNQTNCPERWNILVAEETAGYDIATVRKLSTALLHFNWISPLSLSLSPDVSRKQMRIICTNFNYIYKTFFFHFQWNIYQDWNSEIKRKYLNETSKCEEIAAWDQVLYKVFFYFIINLLWLWFR